MVRFAHISDVHLGGWKQEPLQQLNFQSFKMTVDKCLKAKLDFILIAGDLFDSAYPPIEILKETFGQFKRLHDAKIPCFLIAGSHDYSVSGKTFLDVLEKAGFCKNVTDFEEKDGKMILNPTIHEGVAIYGYPGKKAGLEIGELRNVRFNDAPGMFKIFMLHTTIDKAKGTLPIDSLETDLIPKADYYALGHLHMEFQYENFVYPGPIYPNNFQELEDLQFGRFHIVDTESLYSSQKVELRIKDVCPIRIELTNALTATDRILAEIERHNVKDKIVLLRIKGELENGKHSDLDFRKIEEILMKKGAYFMLRNTHDLSVKETGMEIKVKDDADIEEETIKIYSEQNPNDFNTLIPELINSLSMDKQEDEKTEIFNNRLLSEVRKVLKF